MSEAEHPPFTATVNPPDSKIYSHEICPHLWDLIENAAAFGYIDAVEWKEKITGCNKCTGDIFGLIERGLASFEIPGPAGFFLHQMFTTAKAKFFR